MTALTSIRQMVNEKHIKGEKFFSKKSFKGFTSKHVTDTLAQLTSLGYVRKWESHLFRILKPIPEGLSSYKLKKLYHEKVNT